MFDLDGVLVAESYASGERLMLLHANAAANLAEVTASIFVLTHRSRREAEAILECLGLAGPTLVECITANDLLMFAAKGARWSRLFRDGILKSFALDYLHTRYSVPPHRVCLVDDREENLRDVLHAGAGLAVLAPFRMSADTLETFCMRDLVNLLNDWATASAMPSNFIHRLTEVLRPHDPRRLTNVHLAPFRDSFFNRARSAARRLRYLRRRRGNDLP